MRVLEKRAMRGPNYWSTYWKNLILIRLDLEDYEQKPTDLIPGFRERIEEAIPSVRHHQCSYYQEGGFLRRISEGTWAGHVIEHIALELQTLAGMDTGFGRTRATALPGIYNVVFNYFEEECGLYAADAAVEVFLALAEDMPMDQLKNKIAFHVKKMAEIREEVCLGPSTSAIVNEALERGIPFIRLNDSSLVQLGYGIYQQRIEAASTSKTSIIAVELAGDKNQAKRLLAFNGIPVPPGKVVEDESELEDALLLTGFPAVIKPLDSNQGKGINLNLMSLEEAVRAFREARAFSESVLVEKQLIGRDFRALVVNNKFIAAAERVPAHVVGDGVHSIGQLVDIVNKDPWRGNGHVNNLTRISIDEQTLRLLKEKNYSPETVLKLGEICCLKSTANLSTGGTAIDRTDEVHPYNAFIFERIARIIGLDIAGLDIIAPDISTPLNENGGGIVEVNAAPGLRMHTSPSIGRKRNVAKNIVDMLYPPGAPSRIPIISITGTNGKTTTTRLIAHIIRSSGKKVGFTTTDGIYIDNNLVEKGDDTGPISAKKVLSDSSVEVAVLETARGGILRSGLGFDRCNIGVVLNITADHLGQRDIYTLEDIAKVKSVVPNSVSKDGFVILNADDPLVYNMRHEVLGKVCLFSMKKDNPCVLEHIARGNIACIAESGYVTLARGDLRLRVEKIENIPLTFSGRALFMVQNVLAATLAAFVHDIDLKVIKKGLNSFKPTPENVPGRMNLIEMGNFTVLVDYAHNPSGFMGLYKFFCRFPHPVRTGIFGGTGDRRDEDIFLLGRMASRMFTRVIIKEDKERRGRKPGEMTKLIIDGIHSKKPNLEIHTIPKEEEAILYGIENASENELMIVLVDEVQEVLKLLNEKKKDMASKLTRRTSLVIQTK
ncbi:MAG: cyanophycin synthetase [Ignavibacteria bacterium]|jgi:cyanophycin synthetase|nr:cyanophycin synthetase [Ignavibacteria bacterium]MCU7504488.1 cyanophycin synthetase [Ignavibacteria bacterium]MCU7517933.1 cyanophycin synthetase [Ignavibacteria bacterium]